MRKQRQRPGAQLIRTFVFATYIVHSLSFLNPKFQTYSHLLWLYSPACVRIQVFWLRGSFLYLQKRDARIIMTACYEDKARLILCHVGTKYTKKNMTGRGSSVGSEAVCNYLLQADPRSTPSPAHSFVKIWS